MTHGCGAVALFRAARDNCLRPIHIAIAALKFGFEADLKLRQIDHVPAREFPMPRLARPVFEAQDEMDRIVAHLVRLDFRLVIKCAEAARPA